MTGQSRFRRRRMMRTSSGGAPTVRRCSESGTLPGLLDSRYAGTSTVSRRANLHSRSLGRLPCRTQLVRYPCFRHSASERDMSPSEERCIDVVGRRTVSNADRHGLGLGHRRIGTGPPQPAPAPACVLIGSLLQFTPLDHRAAHIVPGTRGATVGGGGLEAQP